MNKTVIITGASRGIGRACAELFAQNAYNVIINYNKSEAEAKILSDALNLKGLSSVCIKADVSKPEEVNYMVEETVRMFGSVDVLICNAGISQIGLVTDVTDSEWNNMLGVNLSGIFYCARAALPNMINKKSGKIINISSMWGICGASCEVAYSASKAGVIGFTKALAKEVGPSGIAVNCIAPGVIDTQMNSELTQLELSELCDETPLGRLGKPEEIASLAYFLSESGGDFITGQVISPNGGFLV